MTDNFHTPIPVAPVKPPADSETFNVPLGELDAALTDHEARIDALENEFSPKSNNPSEYLNGDGNWSVPAGTGSTNGHVIQDEGVDLTQRAKLNFVGSGVTVTDDPAGTTVTIPGGGVTDHGALSGLGDDDHTQYHNDARGDARYPRKYTDKTAAPTVNDDSGDGYAVGDKWLDTTNDKEYVALDVTLGAAVWKETTSTGGGLIVSIASVTTSNVTGVEGTHHILDVSGMTANRDFNLPTPSEAGKRVRVTLSNGDNSYALIVKINAVEYTRLFITNETLEFVSTGTGVENWQLSYDGRICSKGVMERQTAQSINTNTDTKIQTSTIISNAGDVCDNTVNYRVTVRRAGLYSIKAYVAFAGAIDDQEGANAQVWINNVLNRFMQVFVSAAVADRQGTAEIVFEKALAVGDYVELYAFHNEGASVNTSTSSYPQLSVIELL